MTVSDRGTSPQGVGRFGPAVLTLAGRDAGAKAAAARAAIEGLDGACSAVAVLGPEAVEIPFTGAEPRAAEDAARQALAGAAVDLAAQPAAGRRKKLLVADMESTVIRNEMLDELAELVGRRAEVEDTTARAMRGELDFEAAVRERVAVLAGLPSRALEEVVGRIVPTPGAAELVATMRAHGAATALVSGGFDYFTERIRRRFGFDLGEANRLEIRDGHLTGRALPPIRGRAAKLATLRRLAEERGLSLDDAVTVGDGANDLDMLRAAGLGVAFHAKPAVAEAARFRIVYGDLRTLLYFQGYHLDEFVQI